MSTGLRHPNHRLLHLLKQPNGKSKKWYGGFYWKGKFLRRSTGTDDFDLALKKAEKWFFERRYELEHGISLPVRARRFDSFVEATLQRLLTSRSPAYATTIRQYLAPSGSVHRFFASKAVDEVSSSSWDEFRGHVTMERLASGKPNVSEQTLHQWKVAVRQVLKQAQLERSIDVVPKFTDLGRQKPQRVQARVYFNLQEYRFLRRALLENTRDHQKARSRWASDAQELQDYVIFMVSTGLRVGEAKALMVKDVRIVEHERADHSVFQVCEITVRDGKQGPGLCTSYTNAPRVFRRILQRRGICDPASCTEPLFEKHHREAFKRVLKDAGLYRDALGRKRDFVALRHTYICFALDRNVPIQDIARNARTSVAMIERHYARALPPNASVLVGGRLPRSQTVTVLAAE